MLGFDLVVRNGALATASDIVEEPDSGIRGGPLAALGVDIPARGRGGGACNAGATTAEPGGDRFVTSANPGKPTAAHPPTDRRA